MGKSTPRCMANCAQSSNGPSGKPLETPQKETLPRLPVLAHRYHGQSLAALDVFPNFVRVIAPVGDQNGGLRQGVSHHQLIPGVIGILPRRDLGPHREAGTVDEGRWILVENPPLERPRASFGVPLLRPPRDDAPGSLCCRPSAAGLAQPRQGSRHSGCPPTALPASSGGTGGRPRTTCRTPLADPARAH